MFISEIHPCHEKVLFMDQYPAYSTLFTVTYSILLFKEQNRQNTDFNRAEDDV